MKTTFKKIALTLIVALSWGGASFAQANQPGAGNCLQFDGMSNRVLITSSAAINFNYTNSFSFETWVKNEDITLERRIINKQQNVTNELHITLGMGSDNGINPGMGGRFYFKIGGQNAWAIYAYSTFIANTFDYYHLAGVYDGNTIYLYVNGILQNFASRGANTTIVSPANIQIARLYNNTDYYTGLIDEVRIWNVALTQTQIRDNMCQKLIGNEAGLVGYWRFDEITGNTAFDSQTNVAPNNGTGF